MFDDPLPLLAGLAGLAVLAMARFNPPGRTFAVFGGYAAALLFALAFSDRDPQSGFFLPDDDFQRYIVTIGGLMLAWRLVLAARSR